MTKNRMDQHYSTLYGWTEQNICAWGVEKKEVDLIPSEDGVTMMENGMLIGLDCRGEWFLSFREAKRAAIEYWQEQLETAKLALRDIRQQRTS